MTRKQAVKMFKEEIFPNWKIETKTTVRCAFNDWVEMLSHNGQISDKQRNNWCWNGGKV